MYRSRDGVVGGLCRDPITIAAVAAVVGTGASIYQGEQQARAAKSARGVAAKQAGDEVSRQKTELAKQEQQRRSRETRDLSLARNARTGAGAGVSSTRLTGPGGINPSLLNLAQNTLLG